MYQKNLTASAVFEPANSGTRGQHANHQTTEAVLVGTLRILRLDLVGPAQRTTQCHIPGGCNFLLSNILCVTIMYCILQNFNLL
jgi:hypothetical protein